MAWVPRFAMIKAPACAIMGIRGVNLSFTLCQSTMRYCGSVIRSTAG